MNTILPIDAKQKFGRKLSLGLRHQCLHEFGIVVDDNLKSDGLRKYESWFQLAFRDVEVWDLQDQIFTMWENIWGSRGKGKRNPELTPI